MASAYENNPIHTGFWGEAYWELHRSIDISHLDPHLITGAGSVAIRDLASGEVVLTFNPGRTLHDGTLDRPKYEIPFGHVDPLFPDDPQSPKEDPERTAWRETMEEVGFDAFVLRPFMYRKVYNPPHASYPEIAYNIMYYGLTAKPLITPTDPVKTPASGSFFPPALDIFVEVGTMNQDERDIVHWGVEGARNFYVR